jgi:3-phenylpropionate/trans-cinnamate dioxygenase ferredoxin subunit
MFHGTGIRKDVIFVCKTSEVPASACREFVVDRRRFLICERNGSYYAHSSSCPHQGNSLDGAQIWGDAIDCPWHHYLFDLVTGTNLYPKGTPALRTYPAEVRDGAVFVALQ